MKNLRYLLLVAIAFGFGGLKGQGVNLRLDSVSLNGLPSVVNQNSQHILSIVIHNDSAATFYGVINIGGRVDSTDIIADTNSTSTFVYPTDGIADSIPGDSSIVRELIINVNNPPFIIGSSGVVIWPIVVSVQGNLTAHIPDSISKAIYVLPPVGIDEIAERKLKVYMSGQLLMIQNAGGYLLKEVTLYDVTGNLLQKEGVLTSGTINMNQYAEGVYFVEVTFADNTRATVKLMNVR